MSDYGSSDDEEKTFLKVLNPSGVHAGSKEPQNEKAKDETTSCQIANHTKLADSSHNLGMNDAETKTGKNPSGSKGFADWEQNEEARATPVANVPTVARREVSTASNMSGGSIPPPPQPYLQRSIPIQPVIGLDWDNPEFAPGAVRVFGPNYTHSTTSSLPGESSESSSSCSSHPSNTTAGEDVATPVVTTAVRVQDPDITRREIEAEIRQSIMNEVVLADAVVIPVSDSNDQEGGIQSDDANHLRVGKRKRLCLYLILALVLLAVVAVVAGIALPRASTNSTSTGAGTSESSLVNNATTKSTLEIVRERGYVKCGVSDGFVGFASTARTGKLEGISVDQCRAIAIVVFGNPNQVELIDITIFERGQKLYERTVDVVGQYVLKRMKPDVHDPAFGRGLTFSAPFFYSGFGFVGEPSLVDCADRLDSFSEECRPLRLCVTVNTVNEDTLQEVLPGAVVVPCDLPIDLTHKFIRGDCNVLATQPAGAAEERFRLAGYDREFKVGENLFSMEAMGMVTIDDDPEWARVVNLVILTFFIAEAHSITQANAEDMRSLFHVEDQNNPMAYSMVTIVNQFGNYAELYERHLESVAPRRGPNILYSQSDTSGRLYSVPFRNLDVVGPGPIPNRTLDTIIKRGHLRCGVRAHKGFANVPADAEDKWSGLDVEFCRALGAAIFAGTLSSVEFVDLAAMEANSNRVDFGHGNTLLADSFVDVIAGSRVSIKLMLGSEAAPGFCFGQTYFVNAGTMSEYALMTRDDDSQWVAFVYWVTMAIIYAEEKSIGQMDFVQMPITRLFGEELKQCFRDSVAAVGNYGEIYNRTLQSILPRSGPNMLNEQINGSGLGPQHVAVPLY
ncbi:Putative amino-acid ABC transporter-binding protein YhdW [Seminavis robusta]|uniref:Amino-acid ABC transporter-binding protein YhdW n=1 Tax=Seminavis robusta TaxID=568900 RepID=A0A9N8HVD1_9STRA|nr:Putative amino-acid ABC transporter-binding protein YhdW [Seminavis robusta]|eukprot:Sro1967_g308340.1 Putative amino-acid ABC transporter-binding protein YhdW (848) ;mRNA; r:8361-10904